MWAKRLVASAVLGGIVAATGCETCQSCKKSDGGMPPTVGYSSPAPAGGLPPAVGQTLMGALASVFPDGAPEFFYHVHSYHPAELPEGSALAFADYGERFATIVGRDNVLGAQFHPEKSQRAGIGLLSAFAGWSP